MSEVRLRHRIEYALVQGVLGAARILPESAVRALGTGIGYLYWAVDAKHRRLAAAQLQAAFPTRSADECAAIARRAFVHFGRALAVLLKFSTLTPERIRARVEFDGLEQLKSAQASGRGVLAFSGHFGYWELYALAHPLVVSPISVVARQLDNPLLDARLERIRQATGNTVIYKQGAARRMLRALEAGQVVATLIDQYTWTADAVTVDFFGRPAPTSSVVPALSLRTGAPLVPFFALPLDDGRYRVVYEPAVAAPAADCADPLHDLTQRAMDVLEMYVRRYPHLWLWMHRRWREAQP